MTDQAQTESPTISRESIAATELAALRDKIAGMVPNVIPELIKGDTVASLMSSIDESRAIFDRYATTAPVAAAVVEPAPAPAGTFAAAVIPAPPVVPGGGAPFTEDVSKLPAMELIRRGLQQAVR